MNGEPRKRKHRGERVALNAVILCLTLLFCAVSAPADEKPGADTALSQRETLQLGERMYREGILPSGEPMQAFVKGDLPVSGTAFTCVSCHQRSGLGSVEGGVSTPATNGPELLKPFQMRYTRYGMNKPRPISRYPSSDRHIPIKHWLKRSGAASIPAGANWMMSCPVTCLKMRIWRS